MHVQKYHKPILASICLLLHHLLLFPSAAARLLQTRQLVLESFERCFEIREALDMRVWFEAVGAFELEWEEDDESERIAFFEREKAGFDEARAFLQKGDVRENLDMNESKAWEEENESEKAQYFERMKNIYEDAKVFLEKVRQRPSGIWFRPKVDTVYIRSGCTGGSVVDVLGCLKGGEAEAGNVRSLAVDEFVIGKHQSRTWDTLLYVSSPKKLVGR